MEDVKSCCVISETSSWTEVTLPQLSIPKAGHSIITIEADGRHRFSEDEKGRSSGGKSLLVFGGGDNEGSFYSDLTTVSVEELLLLEQR